MKQLSAVLILAFVFVAPVFADDLAIQPLTVPMLSDALYAEFTMYFEDWSERSRTLVLDGDEIVCGGPWTYYCPFGTDACLALTVPDTSGILSCPKNQGPRHEPFLDGEGNESDPLPPYL